jgi:hypothetical protein
VNRRKRAVSTSFETTLLSTKGWNTVGRAAKTTVKIVHILSYGGVDGAFLIVDLYAHRERESGRAVERGRLSSTDSAALFFLDLLLLLQYRKSKSLLELCQNLHILDSVISVTISLALK